MVSIPFKRERGYKVPEYDDQGRLIIVSIPFKRERGYKAEMQRQPDTETEFQFPSNGNADTKR